MSSQVKLTYGGEDYIVSCNNITISWKNNNIAKPNANGETVTSVQTQSFENPTYVIKGVHLIEGDGNLDYATLLTMAKSKYIGTNPILLTVDYSVDGTKILTSSAGLTPIPTVIDNFNFPIDINEYNDGSNIRHLMIGTITLRETA